MGVPDQVFQKLAELMNFVKQQLNLVEESSTELNGAGFFSWTCQRKEDATLGLV